MDLTRHLSVFDPARVEGRVAVAGVGALGTAAALQLAKLGLADRLVLIDPDVVESHNLPNQMLYGPTDVGLPKVEAAALTLESLTGAAPIAALKERLVSRDQLTAFGVRTLFVCVDSMAARATIHDSCVRGHGVVTWFVEGRMNARQGACYACRPTLARCTAYAERALYPDADVPEERGACGNTLSIGATATVVACQMTWAFMHLVNNTPAWEELSFGVDHLEVHQRSWLSDEHRWRRA